MSNAINARLAMLTSYYIEIDALISTEGRIIDTYDGLISQCNNGEGADHLFASRDSAASRIVGLRADRVEVDQMWNEALLAHEAA